MVIKKKKAFTSVGVERLKSVSMFQISFNRNGRRVSVCVLERFIVGLAHVMVVWVGVVCRFDWEVELDHICLTDLHNEN